jgi:hypothetical protein
MISNQICYIHVRGQKPGQRIGIVQYLDKGYYATNLDSPALDNEAVEDTINYANERLGVSPDVRYAMEIGSMMNWRVPGARAALEHFGKPETILVDDPNDFMEDTNAA